MVDFALTFQRVEAPNSGKTDQPWEDKMLKLNVPDMTCGHCVATVTKAVQAVDGRAVVTVDLPTRTVTVETDAEASRISTALASAGYASTPG